jgi:hypothetical protein
MRGQQERGEEGDEGWDGMGGRLGKGKGWLRGAADFNGLPGLWDAEEPSTG